jgi:glycosyltransferase involved in cell wall biosynthesis
MNRPHVVMLQYGDYRDAVARFASGGAETYVAQRFSVNFVASLTDRASVTVACVPAAAYRERLGNGVTALGLGWRRTADDPKMLWTLEQLRPTHLVLATPHAGALAWALARVPHVLPLFADSFDRPGLRARARKRLLALMLGSRKVPVVANHNVPASLDLVRMGVPAAKVVPWDWPPQNSPQAFTTKTAPDGSRPFSLFFAGAISAAKGVPDVVRAVRLLADRGLRVEASIAGAGETEQVEALVGELGLGGQVRLLGRVPNPEIVKMMRAHDAVVVPSRHEYPEGLAMTIYEGLCSRSPVLLSDHPMFVRALGRSTGVSVFRAGSPPALAEAVERLARDRALYEAISRDSEAAWQSIQVPLKFDVLIGRWLAGGKEDLDHLLRYSLAAHRYAASGASAA